MIHLPEQKGLESRVTEGKEVTEICLQTFRIKTAMRSEGAVEHRVGTLVKEVLL